MKKLISVFALCALFCTGIFALESPNRPIRIEFEYVTYLGLDVKGVYTFRINDVLRWDVGLEVNAIDQALFGRSQNVLAVGSFCFWDFYASYGLGIGFNDAGGAAFIPLDLRIGWQPGARKNNRFAFKLETVLFGNTYGDNRYEYINGTRGKKRDDIRVKTHFVSSPRLNIGLAVRF